MNCTQCGTELAPDDEFCRECGTTRPLVEAERTEPQPPPPPVSAAGESEAPPLRKGTRRKWLAVGCIGLLAIVLMLAGLLGIWLLALLSRSQGLANSEPTSERRPTPTWLPAPPTPTWEPGPPTITPAPSIEPVIVMPYCSALDQSPVLVSENQPVTVYWGWVATTPDYVQDFLDTATIEVLLDGQEVIPETQTEMEYHIEDEGYVVGWHANVGTLAPGSHRLEYHVSWSRQISDGWYTFGPGGEYEEEHEYCELIV